MHKLCPSTDTCTPRCVWPQSSAENAERVPSLVLVRLTVLLHLITSLPLKCRPWSVGFPLAYMASPGDAKLQRPYSDKPPDSSVLNSPFELFLWGTKGLVKHKPNHSKGFLSQMKLGSHHCQYDQFPPFFHSGLHLLVSTWSV